jgi:hypothetical protein
MQVLAGFDEGFAPLSDGAEKSIARSRIDFLGQGFIRFLEKNSAASLWGTGDFSIFSVVLMKDTAA